MTLRLYDYRQHRSPKSLLPIAVLTLVCWIVVILAGIGLLSLVGCAPDGSLSAQGQRVVNVVCRGDALLQPIVVPVIAAGSPLVGPAAPLVAGGAVADQVLVHPAVVAACAQYGAHPIGVVPEVPAGAQVIDQVEMKP